MFLLGTISILPTPRLVFGFFFNPNTILLDWSVKVSTQNTDFYVHFGREKPWGDSELT